MRVNVFQLSAKIVIPSDGSYEFKLVKLKETPHYKFLLGDEQPYIDYMKFCHDSNLQFDHSVEKFRELIKNFDYKKAGSILCGLSSNNRLIIFDGFHRACIMMHRNVSFVNIVMDKQKPFKSNYDKWVEDKGENTLRLDYLLDSNSVVFDVGGYHGWFTEQINEMYGCRIFCFEPVPEYFKKLKEKFKGLRNVTVLPYAIIDHNGKGTLRIDGDTSGVFNKHGEEISISCKTVQWLLKKYDIQFIDLLKLNIEGSEYPLLTNMISKNLIEKCGNIQVQFHTFVEDHETKYKIISEGLSKTHCVTYRYPFIWENWKNIMGSHSQAGQDLFALSQFPEDYKGTFLDIGCSYPDKINNTLLLEEKGWTGFSFDIIDFSKEWETRKNPFIQADCIKCDFTIYDIPKTVDYLSLDIEGVGARFLVLKRLLEMGYEFKVITIEHDSYRGFDEVERNPQRVLLSQKGYTLAQGDVQHNGMKFEDWWIK
jgi:FkbM family methyltransferase